MNLHPRVSKWVVLAFFLLAYNIEFRSLPGSSAFAGLALLTALAWTEPLPLRDHDVLVLLLGGSLFTAVSILRWLDGGTFDVMFRAEYLILFGAPAGIALAMACRRSWSLVLRSIVYAVAVQSLAIFATYALRPARAVVNKLLVESGNISLLYGGRPSGFSNSSGSLLSITQAIGACAGMVWLWSTDRRDVSRKQYWFVAACVVACIGSSLLSGRTAVVVLAIFLIGRSLQYPKLVAIAVGLIGVGVVVLLILPSLIPKSSGLYPQAVDSRQMILDLLKLWRGQFFDVYRTMPWPKVGINLIVGDPLYFAPGHVTHDAGVVQTYGSVGIPAAILAYGPIVWLATQQRGSRLAGWTLLCWIVFLLEWKEPFIFKGPNLAIIVAMSLCEVHARQARRTRVASPVDGSADLDRPAMDDPVKIEVLSSAT